MDDLETAALGRLSPDATAVKIRNTATCPLCGQLKAPELDTPTGSTSWRMPTGSTSWRMPTGSTSWRMPTGSTSWRMPTGSTSWRMPTATTTLTEEMVAELVRLEAEAIPAPWTAGGCAADESHVYAPSAGDDVPYEDDEWLGVIMAKFAVDPHVGWTREWRHGLDIANGRLTAAARNALPALLAERTEMLSRIQHLQASLDDYDNRITWFTTCQQCANLLDKSYQDYERVKELEAALTELVALKDNVKKNDLSDYEERKPLAWEEARRVLKGDGE